MKIKLWMGAVGLALSLLVQPTAAGQYEDGTAAYHHKDYQTALKLWQPLAEQGDVKAQYNLGVMYKKGLGVTKDYAQAHMWFHLAAIRGDANAIKPLDRLSKLMTPAQIAKAQKLANEWEATHPKS